MTALAVSGGGSVYAGSAPGGILYRIDPQGRVFVLHDSPYREVKALEPGADGSVYAAVVDGREKDEAARPGADAAGHDGHGADGRRRGHGDRELRRARGRAGRGSGPVVQTPEPARSGPTKGAVLRLLASGEVDTLWSSSEETPHALAWSTDGLWWAPGNKGKLYRVRDDRTWAMVATFPAEQVTALRGRDGDAWWPDVEPGPRCTRCRRAAAAAGSLRLEGEGHRDRLDSWGRLRWDATSPPATRVEVQTRSGNTGSPDATWTDWSAAYTRAARRSGDERARALPADQGHAPRHGQRGRRSSRRCGRRLPPAQPAPQMQTVTVHPPGEVFQKPLSLTGEVEILGPATRARSRPSGRPPRREEPAAAGHQLQPQALPEGHPDVLVERRTIRTATRWRTTCSTARSAKSGSASCAAGSPSRCWPGTRRPCPTAATWSAWPRATRRSNPPAAALTATLESEAFDVDNTPPTVTSSCAARFSAGHRGRGPGRPERHPQGRIFRGRRPVVRGATQGRHRRRPRGGLRHPSPLRHFHGRPYGRDPGPRRPRQRRHRERGRHPLSVRPRNASPLRKTRTLVVRAGSLGDVLLLRPALAALRGAGHEVWLLSPPPGRLYLADDARLLAGWLDFESPAWARCLAGDRSPWPEAWPPFGSALVISKDAGVIEAISRHVRRVTVCAAFPPRDMHASENCVAALAGWGVEPSTNVPLFVPRPDPGEQAADLLARLGAGFVAVHPGSGSARKNAPAALFAALCRELSPTAPWLLIEGPADEVAAAAVASVPGAVRTGALRLHALAAILSRASLYVGNDSAVTHLAAALGVPTVALFGPTDPRTWAPVGPRVAFVAAPQGDLHRVAVEDVLVQVELLRQR